MDHSLSIDKIRQIPRSLKAADVWPEEKLCIELNPERLNSEGWWIFGALNEADLARVTVLIT